MRELCSQASIAWARFGIYTIAVVLFTCLLHSWYEQGWPILAVPVFAEIALAGSDWNTRGFARAFIVRFAGLLIGSAAAYFAYVLPFIGDTASFKNDLMNMLAFATLELSVSLVSWGLGRKVLRVDRPVRSTIAFCIYSLLVFGVLSSYNFTAMFLAPLIAEIALIRSEWTHGGFMKATVSRFLGITAGAILNYNIYVLHFVFDGTDPYGEDAALLAFFVPIQTLIAIGAWAMDTSFFPHPAQADRP